jgi:very-short-patch-repair endonuclease
MRKAPTEAERRLWWALRHRLAIEGSHFRRQVVIGRAIVDFACIAARLVVEVDGNQHGADRALAYDAERARLLEATGWRVLRFSNADVMTRPDEALDTIRAAIEGEL